MSSGAVEEAFLRWLHTSNISLKDPGGLKFCFVSLFIIVRQNSPTHVVSVCELGFEESAEMFARRIHCWMRVRRSGSCSLGGTDFSHNTDDTDTESGDFKYAVVFVEAELGRR